jgi:hypothetical protein
MKHTPGPWQFIEESTQICGAHGETVFFETGSASPEDCRLAAAAPELLEACKTMAEWFKREHEGFPNAGQVRTTPAGEAAWRKWWEENLRLCDLAKTQANAAIAKATE